MTKNDIHLLYEYDRWANARVLNSVAPLDGEQFTREVGGSFRSLRDTLVHLISGEWIWLQFWKAPPTTPEAMSKLRARREAMFNPSAFPDAGTVQSKWAEVAEEQIRFVDGLTDESVQQLLPFRSGQIQLALLMQHLANHSTYHRGQVSMIMRQLGAEPVATDFHVFLAEGYLEASPK